MKFKIDENLPGEIAANLRALGHDADTVHDEGLQGAPDPSVVQAALGDQRIILTLDKGIASLLHYPDHAGVVLFRPDSTGRRAVLQFVRDRLPELLQIDLTRRVVVVGAMRIRIR